MKKFSLSVLLFAAVLQIALAAGAAAQGNAAPDSADRVWSVIENAAFFDDGRAAPSVGRFQAFRLNKQYLEPILASAPPAAAARASTPVVLTLPLPSGRFARFAVESAPIVAPELAARFPQLKTYLARGLDDPTATARLSDTPTGFRAIVYSAAGTVIVDPAAAGDTEHYISFRKEDAERGGEFFCLVKDGADAEALAAPDLDLFRPFAESGFVINGAILRTYRLALAATAEFTNVFRQTGDTDEQAKARALEQQVIVMNRVNGVYERDLAVRMVIVANNDRLIYTDPAADPYTNNSGPTMLGENQSNIDAVVGTNNYDVGHVFSTGGGGVANLRVPCSASSKARGVTGLANPRGDPFAIDYVAHEIGHQFGGNHTFNGASSNCSGNRSGSAAYEPGSGITIMGYAGICGGQDLARNSIDTFHVRSLEEIVNFINNPATGDSCPLKTPTGNTPPVVSIAGGADYTIPKQTPFALSASAIDAEGDAVTFDWQQYDLGLSTSAVPNTDADGTARPIFRPFSPNASGLRYFPSLQYVLNNANVPPATFGCGRSTPCLTGELLPAIARTMNFQAIARDNRPGAGAINTATARVTIDAVAGPFAVTFPNSPVTITVSDHSHEVTWSVAGTDLPPVNAARVRILASVDGGQTFPYVLNESTPNDGREQVFLPGVETTTARIKIEAVGNVFFDVSDANFTIRVVPFLPARPIFDFDGDGKTDFSVFRPDAGQWWINRSTNGSTAVTAFGASADVLAPADYTGDGRTDIAFFRPASGEWFVVRREDNTFYSFPFGASGDIPAPADFDGDGRSDPAVFRPSNGTWYISKSTGGTSILPFGTAGDRPVIADYDGDGKADIAVYRPSVSQWWIMRSNLGLVAMQFGASGDRAVPGDFTGDGRADVALFRPASGEWFVLRSENNTFYAFPFGANGDIPVTGDYDGDGRADPAVFRPASSTWFVNGSSAGVIINAFGASGDRPLPAAFTGADFD